MKENKNNKKRLNTNSKMTIIITILAFFVFVYILRLYQLQIVDAYDFKNKGNAVSMVGKVVKAKRGNIFDRNNKPLAISQDVESLYLMKAITKEKYDEAIKYVENENLFNTLSIEDKNKYISDSVLPVYTKSEVEKLGEILGIDSSIILKKLESQKEGYIYKPLTKLQKEKINLLDLKYIQYLTINDRYYPNNEVLSSVLGFIDEETNSKLGLEQYYDKELSGKDGYRQFYKALHGTEIPYMKSNNIEPVDGKNLYTTIDIDLQNIVSKHMRDIVLEKKPMNAVAILTNPNNGEILAMESFPNFNANSPRDLSDQIDKNFLEKLPKEKELDYLVSRWNNKAVSIKYDPGSVYKLVTAAIALESNNSLKNKIYEDKGFLELAPGVVIKSWRYWDPHGNQNLKEALKNSSNPVFAQLAKDIGKKRYIEYAKPFNLGKKSGIDLPNEVEGFFPKDENISDVDFGTLSYGHFLNVNSTQLLASVNSIVNGGKYYKPHIVKRLSDKNGNSTILNEDKYISKVISEKTSNEMLEYMEYTAEYYGLNSENLKFGAKSGTTVKYGEDSIFVEKTDEKKEGLILSLYTIYPSKNPKYSLYIMIDEPLNTSLSAEVTIRVTKNIFNEIILRDSNENKQVTDITQYVEIPNLIGMTIEDSLKILDEKGLKLKSDFEIGKFHIVESQFPEQGNLITKGESVIIKSSSKIKVPDLTNYTIDDAVELLEKNKINFKIIGNGKKVKEQSVKSGKLVNIDTVLEIVSEE